MIIYYSKYQKYSFSLKDIQQFRVVSDKLLSKRRMLSGGVVSPITKICVDVSLLSGCLFLSSKIGVTSVMRDLVPLRKKLLNEPDIDYLRHILSKYKKFDFYKQNEFTLYHDVLTLSEFKSWKQLHSFDVTKF